MSSKIKFILCLLFSIFSIHVRMSQEKNKVATTLEQIHYISLGELENLLNTIERAPNVYGMK